MPHLPLHRPASLRLQGLFFVIVLAAWMVVIASTAHSHSWYSGKTDPVFGNSCCGGTDCAMWAIQPGEMTLEAEGIHVRLSLERTREINPHSTAPIDALIKWARVQPSEDGNFHLCIMTFSRENLKGGIYCLFTPPNS